jgi:glycosyltransferase involved in cell wall biosynthesis
MHDNLMVSVKMITYNHENFIAQAIGGILMQETNFEFELIIADDCSTDKTGEVVKSIIATNPKGGLIKYFRHKQNLGVRSNGMFALNQCLGKYIALCEGDDYWTDQFKLQKQIDFLESHLEVSVCFHEYLVLNDSSLLPSKYDSKSCLPVNLDNFFFRSYSDSKYWVTQPLTAVFRSSSLNMAIFNKYKKFKDYHLFYHFLQSGVGYYMSDVMAVYRQHQFGVFTSASKLSRMKEDYEIKQEIYIVNNDFSYKSYYEGAAALYIIELLKSKQGKIFDFIKILHECARISLLSSLVVIMKSIYYSIKIKSS